MSFNAAVKDGTAAAKLNRILEALKPQATFKADVELRVVMTPEDLKKSGIDDLRGKWGQ